MPVLYDGVSGSKSLPRSSMPTITGSNPASRANISAVSSAVWSSLANGMPTRSPSRCASRSRVRKLTELNAFTHRLPGNIAAAHAAVPRGWRIASCAASPSRLAYAFPVSSTTLPVRCGARVRARSGIAASGTVSMTTSPNAAASSAVPATPAGRASPRVAADFRDAATRAGPRVRPRSTTLRASNRSCPRRRCRCASDQLSARSMANSTFFDGRRAVLDRDGGAQRLLFLTHRRSGIVAGRDLDRVGRQFVTARCRR